MDTPFDNQESLLRAVWPPDRRPDFWVNGRQSSAALKDKRGLSVDRTLGRTLDDSIAYIIRYQHGPIVTVTVPECRAVNAYLLYKPTKNKYHSEIHGSETEILLSDEQALELARVAKLVYEPDNISQISEDT